VILVGEPVSASLKRSGANMAVYSVFEPPARKEDGADHPERFAFVRDGFSWSACILGPFWMLWHWLLLVLLLWVVVVIGVAVLARVLSVALGSEATVILLLAVLVGFEASTLRRWTLLRRGWRDLGIVVADDPETAERRFFDDWVTAAAPAVLPAPRSRRSRLGNPQAQDIIGLFPEPGGVNR
jgi:Protein of unknown function (DUF2628)